MEQVCRWSFLIFCLQTYCNFDLSNNEFQIACTWFVGGYLMGRHAVDLCPGFHRHLMVFMMIERNQRCWGLDVLCWERMLLQCLIYCVMFFTLWMDFSSDWKLKFYWCTSQSWFCSQQTAYTVESTKLVGTNFRGLLKILQVWGDVISCIFLYIQKDYDFIALVY